MQWGVVEYLIFIKILLFIGQCNIIGEWSEPKLRKMSIFAEILALLAPVTCSQIQISHNALWDGQNS